MRTIVAYSLESWYGWMSRRDDEGDIRFGGMGNHVPSVGIRLSRFSCSRIIVDCGFAGNSGES